MLSITDYNVRIMFTCDMSNDVSDIIKALSAVYNVKPNRATGYKLENHYRIVLCPFDCNEIDNNDIVHLFELFDGKEMHVSASYTVNKCSINKNYIYHRDERTNKISVDSINGIVNKNNFISSTREFSAIKGMDGKYYKDMDIYDIADVVSNKTINYRKDDRSYRNILSYLDRVKESTNKEQIESALLLAPYDVVNRKAHIDKAIIVSDDFILRYV